MVNYLMKERRADQNTTSEVIPKFCLGPARNDTSDLHAKGIVSVGPLFDVTEIMDDLHYLSHHQISTHQHRNDGQTCALIHGLSIPVFST